MRTKQKEIDNLALLFDDVQMAEMGFSRWKRTKIRVKGK
jgi:hypothetical protein